MTTDEAREFYGEFPCKALTGPEAAALRDAAGLLDDALDELRLHWHPAHGLGLLQPLMAANAAGAEARPHLGGTTLGAWARDRDAHGVVHGLATWAWARAILGPPPPPHEGDGPDPHEGARRERARWAASCLLHDYARCYGPSAVRGHDAAVRHVFPNLHPSAYHHQSAPDEASVLVQADRLELHRYPDHAAWLERGRLPERWRDGDAYAVVRAFYRYVRPWLDQAWAGRNAVWVRHGVETPAVVRAAIKAQGGHAARGKVCREYAAFPWECWSPYRERGAFCAETGRLEPPHDDNRLLAGGDHGLLGLVRLDGVGAVCRVRAHADHEVVEDMGLPLGCWSFLTARGTLPLAPADARAVMPAETLLKFLAVADKIVAVAAALSYGT